MQKINEILKKIMKVFSHDSYLLIDAKKHIKNVITQTKIII